MAVQDLQDTIAGGGGRVGPSVVGLGRGWGLGSGVVIGDGQVLTAAQNLRREELTVVFADGGRETAAPGGVDPDLGLAVLSVPTGDRPAVTWEPAGEPGIGAAVMALANPGGRGLRATLGFVSSEARSFRGPRGRRVRGDRAHRPAPARVVRQPARRLCRQPARHQQHPARRRPDPRRPRERGGTRADRSARTRRGARPAPARRGGRAAARGAPHAACGRPARARGLLVRAVGRPGRRTPPASSAAT